MNKFRVWDNKEKCYLDTTVQTKYGNTTKIMIDDEGDLYLTNDEQYYPSVHELLDNNDSLDRYIIEFRLESENLEVYVGDIVKIRFYDYFEEAYKVSNSCCINNKLKIIEVVGNIHQHKNLLRKKSNLMEIKS